MARITLDDPVYVSRGTRYDEDEEDPLSAFLLPETPTAPAAPEPGDLDALMLEDSPEVENQRGAVAGIAPMLDELLAERRTRAPQPVPARQAPVAARPAAPAVDDEAELRRAQKAARTRYLVATLGRGLNQAIGAPSQDSSLAALQNDAERPVQELMQRRELRERKRAQDFAERGAQRRESREDERRDPASPINRRFQAMLRSRFSEQNLPSDVLSQMTVEDQESVGLVQASQQARERLDLMRQQRAMELEDMERQQQHQIGLEQMRHEGDLEEIQARRARRGGGGAGGAARNPNSPLALAMRERMAGRPVPPEVLSQLSPRELGQLDNVAPPRAEAALTPYQQAQQERAERSDTRSLGTDLARSGALEQQAMLGRAMRELERADDTDFRAAVAAPSWAPDALMPGRSGSLRQSLAQVRNLTLKDRSGAAINDAEFTRLTEELGTGALQSREAVQRGLRRLQQIARDHQATIEGGYSPETVETYHGQRGQRLQGGQRPAQGGGGQRQGGSGMVRMRAPDGSTALVPPDRVAEYERRGAQRVQ